MNNKKKSSQTHNLLVTDIVRVLFRSIIKMFSLRRNRHVTFLMLLPLFIVSMSLSIYWIHQNPQTQNPKRPDAILNERVAENIAKGNGFSADYSPVFRPEITRTPVFPYVAALTFFVAGENRKNVLYLNAFFIATSLLLAFFIFKKLFSSTKASYLGVWIACLVPQVSGAANSFLTEPLAMFQVTLVVFLILKIKTGFSIKKLSVYMILTGLALAFLLLNRLNFILLVFLISAWILWIIFKSSHRLPGKTLAIFLFAASLGIPVLSWSARNYSCGLMFSPKGVGQGASFVLGVTRYRDIILDPGEDLPVEKNEDFWNHYLYPQSPQRLIHLDKKNLTWFRKVVKRRYLRMLRLIPNRFVQIFSNRRISNYYQPFPAYIHKVRQLSQILWILSLAGAVLIFKKKAMIFWFIPVSVLTFFHIFTIPIPRYMTPLLPLTMPYIGILITRVTYFIQVLVSRLKSRIKQIKPA